MSTNEQVKTVAVISAQALVTAFQFSAFAQAIGMLMAGTSMTVAPRQSYASPKAILDLRASFGNDIVDKALKDAGPNADIVSIAEAVDQEFNRYLRTRFTDFEVTTAIQKCPPGDLRCVIEVANALHKKGVTATSPVAQTEAVTTTAAVAAKKKNALAGPHKGRPMKDLVTGVTYRSLAQAAKALAPIYGVDTSKGFYEYKVLQAAKDRLVYL